MFKVVAVKATDHSTPPKRICEASETLEGLAERVVEKLRNAQPCTVLVTRELEQEGLLTRTLDANRYKVIGLSFIGREPVKFNKVPEADWVFFASRTAVRSFFEQNPVLDKKTKFGAMGSGTAEEIKKFEKEVSFIGDHSDPSVVGERFAKQAGNSKVLFPRSERSLKSVQKAVASSGKALDLIVYKTSVKSSRKAPGADVVVFTSPSNVEGFFGSNDLENVKRVVAIGPSTAAKLREYGVSDPVVPDLPDENGLLQAIFGLSF
jgi:hydroxymethylbilane synthase